MSRCRPAAGALAGALLALGLAACGDDKPVAPSSAPTPLRIGVFQIVDHPAVNALREGFEEVLKEKGSVRGRTLALDYKNAQNDPSLIEQIAERFAADRVDLVYALGTPVVLSMAAKTSSIPIIAGAMTDPVSAKVADSWTKPGHNITGTSDLPPVEAQLRLALEVLPKMKTIGVVYNTGEKNSVVVVERLQAAAKLLGLRVEERPATTTAEVAPAVTALVGHCDALYLPPDNSVHAALDSYLQTALLAKLPVVNCTEDSVKQGALLALTVDYKELGRLSARIAIEVLEGKSPAEIPFRVIDRPTLAINVKSAQRLGIVFPARMLADAKTVFGKDD